MKTVQPRLRPALLPKCQLPRQVLAAARAPQCLKRQTQQQIRRLPKLAVICKWVEDLSHQRPRLREQPLLGRCLEELAGETTKQHQAEPGLDPVAKANRWAGNLGKGQQDISSAAGRTPEKPGVKIHPGRQDQPHGSTGRSLPYLHPPQNPPAPLSLHQQVDPALLRRLASTLGGPGSQAAGREVSIPGQRPTSAGGRRIARAFRPGASVEGRQPGGIQPAPGLDDRPLFKELAFRTARQLYRAEGALNSQGAAGIVVRGIGVELLAQQWAAPLAGEAAPQALLARLAGMPANDNSAGLSSGLPQRARHAAERSQAGNSRGSGGLHRADDAPEQPQPNLGQPSQAKILETIRVPSPAQHSPESHDPHGFYPEPGSPPIPVEGSALPWTRPPFAPPQAAKNLPTLITPKASYDSPTPAASASLRYEARNDEQNAQEDLNLLAEKIKRILDEEARRHGFDV